MDIKIIVSNAMLNSRTAREPHKRSSNQHYVNKIYTQLTRKFPTANIIAELTYESSTSFCHVHKSQIDFHSEDLFNFAEKIWNDNNY